MSDLKKITTTCTRDCPNTCGLIATVEGGRIASLKGDPDHPYTRGTACVKAARYIDRVYSRERVTRPMIRENGAWRHTSWDEAFALIAARMKSIRDESGPEAILYYQGYGERTALKLLNRYFFNLFGGVTTLRGSLCGGTGQASQNLDFGERISHDPLDHYNSNSMVLWARNPVSTNISLVPIIREIKKRGGRIVLIDPVKTRTVALADLHITPRPGRDVYLAMAAAKLILALGAQDDEFLENRAEGFEQYRDILSRYSVMELCDLADVPMDQVVSLADIFMGQGPTSILLGWGLHRHKSAHLSIRAIDALAAIAGTIGMPGGGVSQGFEEYGPYDQSWWGDDLNPPRRTLLVSTVGEEILNADEPPIRMIYVTASNPVCMAPNSAKVAQAFRKAEFVVYSGHFMDDTADRADVFLPATTFLEEDDVMATYGHNWVGPVNRAIPPVGECRSEFEMFQDLAGHFDFADRFRLDAAAWIEKICAPIWRQGCSPEQLRRGAFRLDAPMVPYKDKTFPTPSGKFRFMTEFDPAEVNGADEAYPYKLITSAPHAYICSERTMAEHDPLPVIRLHPDEAAQRGLEDGSLVLLRSQYGAVRAKLRTENGMRRDVVAAERGGWIKAGHGLNLLTRDMSSTVGMGTPYYETTVSVERCADPWSAQPRILVVQNHEHAAPAALGRELERMGAALDIRMPFEGDALPETPENHAGLVVLGGPQHAFDDADNPYFAPLMRLMRKFDAQRKPVAGVCLGCQLLARAWGGRHRNCGTFEFGFTELSLTTEGENDPILGGPLPRLMEFHEDSFIPPEGATLLATGESCENQCFRIGNASYGFQFRFEVDSKILDNLLTLFRGGEMEKYNNYLDKYDGCIFESMEAELPLLLEESQDFCRRVAENWLKLCADDIETQ
ncbi:molybdopterin oxidoreductase [Oceanidesulfovibrio indonesiensis]|uniref:Molybdopterin oxidoreductase n=1 Tax=Oceanidesulfovibrio indonesiensis TaxID=54767 RepID=A0A7M3MCY5_9BACT|nr:molybdopterin-dependent oxidoreductase [Oceanidesulfovibrio indonesiensis]TVM15945.1 molybdopterin oxidoreductase [Oceanidesulfovibrio indonesiensis]